MTRPVMVRARWDALEPRSRDLLEHVLAAGEGGATVGAIATASDLDVADAREALGDLYRAGMIAHEGSAATLPVGATPVVLCPRNWQRF